jgi:hypothetical protein
MISNYFIEYLLIIGSINYPSKNSIYITLPSRLGYTTTTYGLAIIINWLENKYVMYEKISLFNMSISNIFNGQITSRIDVDFISNEIIFYYKEDKDIDMETFRILDNLGKVTGYSVKVTK